MDAACQSSVNNASNKRFRLPESLQNRRILLLGSPMDALSMDETLRLIEGAMRERTPLQHVVVNVAKLVHMQHDEALYRDVTGSDLINIDGMGVVWGGRWLGHAIPERVAGIDVMDGVLALCRQHGFKPFILGAKPEILRQAAANIEARYPGLVFAGLQDGYYDRNDEQAVMQRIADSGADCLFIAMPSPHKERIMQHYRDMLNVPFIMGVGGSVDVFAGYVTRAPGWMQQAGLEWLYRLLQEPGRMWKRYWHTNRQFAVLLLKAKLGRYQPPGFMADEQR